MRNFPATNKRLLESLHETKGAYFDEAQLACRMEAALRLVLLFHTGTWNEEARQKWQTLQCDAGLDHHKDASTKGLCDVIREVLGEKDPFVNSGSDEGRRF